MTTLELDLASWPIFHAMSRRGMMVSLDRLERLREDVSMKRAEEADVVHLLTGTKLNPASSHEVSEWLKTTGMRGKKTATGQMATDERTMKSYDHPAIHHILEWRGMNKVINTFIDPTLELAQKDLCAHNRNYGVIHPRWRLTKVRSGRVATEDPNLLAFPSRDELGRKVRSCFMPRPGHKFVSIDFSQLEPRIVAALSQDPKLLAVYAEGRDLYDEIAKDLQISRQAAKIVTLGVLYGMGANRLQEQLRLAGMEYDVEYCEALIDRWFATYHGVKTLVDEIVAKARAADGWVYTQGGRGRLLPGLFITGHGWPAEKLREEAERQAFNHVIQGTGMEQLRRAMLDTTGLQGFPHLLLAIHDELMFEMVEQDIKLKAANNAALMMRFFQGVELKTSTSIADDWGLLK